MMTMRVRDWLTLLNSVLSRPYLRPPGLPSGPRGLDHDPRPRTHEAAVPTSALAPPKPRTLINRGVVRGLRQQHGSGADDRALPAFTPGRHRMARGLAADLRR